MIKKIQKLINQVLDHNAADDGMLHVTRRRTIARPTHSTQSQESLQRELRTLRWLRECLVGQENEPCEGQGRPAGTPEAYQEHLCPDKVEPPEGPSGWTGEQIYQHFIRQTRDRVFAENMSPHGNSMLELCLQRPRDFRDESERFVFDDRLTGEALWEEVHCLLWMRTNWELTPLEAEGLLRDWVQQHPQYSYSQIYQALRTGHLYLSQVAEFTGNTPTQSSVTRRLAGFVQTEVKSAATCKDCHYYFGRSGIHCAVHVYGPDGDTCPDWQAKDG